MLPQEQLAQYLAKYAGSFKTIGWTIKDQYHKITTDKKTCDEWKAAGHAIMPVYISHLIDDQSLEHKDIG